MRGDDEAASSFSLFRRRAARWSRAQDASRALGTGQGNNLLVEACRYFPGISQRETARLLRIALTRYQSGRWRREWSEALCPPHHAGRLTAVLWNYLKVRDAPPPSERTAAVVANIESWLRDGRPSGVEVFEGPQPTLTKGQTLVDFIEQVRRRGRELQADLHRIRSAPFPSNHAKQQARAQIEALAERGTPSASRLIEHTEAELDHRVSRTGERDFCLSTTTRQALPKIRASRSRLFIGIKDAPNRYPV